MPRPEKPISANNPLAQFANGLRALRQSAKLTYRQLSAATHYSTSVLSMAAGGQHLPTWEVTSAYVKACGGSLDQWHRLWIQLSDESADTQDIAPTYKSGIADGLPHPDEVNTPAELAASLRALRHQIGDPSYNELSKAAQTTQKRSGRSLTLPRSTVSDMLTYGRPSIETLLAFLAVCKVPESQVTVWLAARERAMSTAQSGLAQQAPGLIGRVLNDDGDPLGTCFQVAPGVLVTAWHVLDNIGAATEDAVVWVDPLVGGDRFDAKVARVNAVHDLAVLISDCALPTLVRDFSATDQVTPGTTVTVTGHASPDISGHHYRFLTSPGRWAGPTMRDDAVQLGRLTSTAVVAGMSGAPVIRDSDNTLVGVVSGRYNSAVGWPARQCG